MSYITVDRDTPLLLPVDLRDWVSADDPVHFVIEAVDLLDLRAFHTGHPHGAGKAQYPPHMMLGLLIYCYTLGVVGSRRIERATFNDLRVRYLTGDTHPDHATISDFGRRNFAAVLECFVEVLEFAREIGLLKVGHVSIEGTHLRANASKDKNLTLARAQELETRLRADVQGLLDQAEAADQAGLERDPRLPEHLAHREALLAKMQEAKAQIEARAQARADAKLPEFEEKLAASKQRKGSGGSPKKPSRERELAAKPGEQANLTDPDSRVMRKGADSTQSYHAQAVVDAEGSQLILGARVSQCSSDRAELLDALDAMPAELDRPTAVLADAGYVSADNINELARRGIEAYIAVHREDITLSPDRRYDFRQDPQPATQAIKIPELVAMKEKLADPLAKAIYARRQQTVEPVFGIIKSIMGFRQFTLRGLRQVRGEWQLVALAYNCKRLAKLIHQAKIAPACA